MHRGCEGLHQHCPGSTGLWVPGLLSPPRCSGSLCSQAAACCLLLWGCTLCSLSASSAPLPASPPMGTPALPGKEGPLEPQQNWAQAGIAALGTSLRLAWPCLGKDPRQGSQPRAPSVSRGVSLLPSHPLHCSQAWVLGAQQGGGPGAEAAVSLLVSGLLEWVCTRGAWFCTGEAGAAAHRALHQSCRCVPCPTACPALPTPGGCSEPCGITEAQVPHPRALVSGELCCPQASHCLKGRAWYSMVASQSRVPARHRVQRRGQTERVAVRGEDAAPPWGHLSLGQSTQEMREK